LYLTVKTIHIIAAILTISGFVLRGLWMITESPAIGRRSTTILPHVVDTLFLITGIWLIWLLRLNVLEQPWLIAKLVALVAYVWLGMLALRRGRTARTRAVAFGLAVLTFAYIAGAAMTKSVSSWLAWAG